ncbi:MAG: DNA polymerase III subunit beta [Candidatus Peribacteraceae bacterium]
MKFSCLAQDLLSGTQLVSRAIGSDQVLPILQNILIHIEGKRCTLSATNLEISIVTSFEVSIENEGSITVPAKALLHFLQYNQDKEVLLETSEGTQLKIKTKSAKASISGEPATGFPTITPVQKESEISVKASSLLHALSLVTFACAKTGARPVISGVYTKLEKGEVILAGTDSYRLSEYRLPADTAEGSVSCIIPARFLEELKGAIVAHADTKKSEKKEEKKAADTMVNIHLSSQQIEVHVGSTKLYSRLIEGKFPDYTQVIPKDRKTVATFLTRDILSAVKRMHYFAKEVNNNILFSCKGSSAHLSTKQTQLGKDESEIECDLKGEENKIALSSNYVIDFLSRIDGDKVAIEISDKMHPAVFVLPNDPAFVHLIMPLRMGEE